MFRFARTLSQVLLSRTNPTKFIQVPPKSINFHPRIFSTFTSSSSSSNPEDPNTFQNIFYEDIIEQHKLNQAITNLSKHSLDGQYTFLESLIRRTKNPNEKSTQQSITQYCEVCLSNCLEESNYSQALKCAGLFLEHLNTLQNQTQYKILLLTSMASWHLETKDRIAGLELLREAEDLFISLNSQSLQQTPVNQLLVLTRVFCEFGLHEKCVRYSAELIDKEDVYWEMKIQTIFYMIQSLTALNKQAEAIAIGQSFLETISFEGISENPAIDLLTQVYERVISLILESESTSNKVNAYLLQDELLSLALIEDKGSMQSLKYTAVFNWKQDILYSILMERNGNVLDILQEAELRRARKKNPVLAINPEEIAKELAEKYELIASTIENQKAIYTIANLLGSKGEEDTPTFEEFTQLIESCVQKEQKLIEAPVVDQYLVKNTYFGIKSKLPKTFQNRIEKALSTKRLP